MSNSMEQCQPETIPKKRGRKPYLTDEEKQQRREAILEKNRILYKEKYGFKRDRSVRSLCECGEDVLLSNAARHRKSTKHLAKVMSNKQLESGD